ncbi:MAG: alpha/beta hydrolase [Psychrobacter sp.]|nr:alpha/beta hydrolase [Psychrobacter sp.]
MGMVLMAAFAVTLSACSGVVVNKQSAAKTLVASRGNIVTDDRLSTATTSALLSAGLDQEACMRYFDNCLMQLSDSLFNEHRRRALAIFAELHYTKALRLNNSTPCQDLAARPPIDPYYANAPLDEKQSQEQKQQAELCFTQYHNELMEAVKYSYAYLFFDQLEHDYKSLNEPRNISHALPSEIDIQTQDIYNAASNDIITQLYKPSNRQLALPNDILSVKHLPITAEPIDANNTANKAGSTPSPSQVKVMAVKLKDYELGIYLPNESQYLINASKERGALTDLISTYEMKLTGLNTISKRDGFGISFVASLDDRYTTSIQQLFGRSLTPTNENDDPTSRIYPTGHLLLTGMIEPQGKSVLDVLSTHKLDVRLFDPYRTDSVTVLGDNYPLAANFSASYGLWLAENQLNTVGYLNLLTRQDAPNLPRLFMLEPYDPNKRVIIMLHGLASSPATWVNLTNDIFNDQTLRDHYQVWQIFYPTNLPILENRYQIKTLIEATYQQMDPKAQNPASQHSVIISHSMGALIARMLVSDDDLSKRLDSLKPRADDPSSSQMVADLGNQKMPANASVSDMNKLMSDRQLTAMIKQTYGNEALASRFDLQPLNQVDTVVFLSAPFRGTDYADRWFTRALRRVIHLPLGLVQTVTSNLSTIATQGELAQNPLGALYLENGASQLSDKSSFVQLTKDLTIVPSVTYHSIIANADADLAEGLAQLDSTSVKLDLSQAQPTSDEARANTITSPDADEIKLSGDAANTKLATTNATSRPLRAGAETTGMTLSSTEVALPPETDSSVSNPKTSSNKTGPKVAAVTVEADIGEALTNKLSDGIVPYKSAHLEGAASETIISGGHSIQENPQTILILRRILHQHLKSHDGPLSPSVE